MPTNLYEGVNSFKLVDVDNYLLAGPLLIREPQMFGDVRITLERTEDHGFDFEFSDAETPFGFDAAGKIVGELYDPYTYIIAMYYSLGVDAKVMLEFYNNGTLNYQSNLDFTTIEIGDSTVKIKARRVNLDDKFRTRIETPVNFASNESIDGTTIPYQTPFEIFCHGLNKDGECIIGMIGDTIFIDERYAGSSVIEVQSGLHILSDATEIYNGNGYDKLGYRNDEFYTTVDYGASGLDVTLNTVVNLIPPYQGAYYIWREYQVEGTCYTDDVLGGVTFNIKAAKYINSVLDSTQIIYTHTAIDDSVTVINVDISFLTAEIVSSTDTDLIEYKILIETRDVHTGGKGVITITDLIFTTHYYSSATPNTLSTCYKPYNALNHILRSICDTSDTLLSSDFLENDINDIVLTNGYKLRNFEDRNVITSFDKIFKKWLKPTFGLGMAVVDDSGFKVLIEPYSFYYQDVEIDYIDSIEDGTFKIMHDKKYSYNELVVGYEKYPEATIENKKRSILEFNTKHDLITPLERIKNKGTFVSDVIASGILIDNQRLTQFSETPNETGDNDDELFCIDSIEYTDYDVNAYFTAPNIITLQGHYYDIRVGAEIVITGSSSNNDTYTVSTVDINLTNSSYFGGLKIIVEGSGVVNESINSINMDFSGTRRNAARNENFDTLNNVSNAATTYNAALNPKVMLINHSLLINSGLNPKNYIEVIKTTFAKLNDAMEFKFDVAPNHSLVDESQTISMSGDLTLSDMYSNQKLFSGLLLKFTCRLSYTRVLAIRDACLYQDPSTNYGYIRVVDERGIDWKGFITKMIYNPLNEKTEFELRHKFDPSGESFDYVLDLVLG